MAEETLNPTFGPQGAAVAPTFRPAEPAGGGGAHGLPDDSNMPVPAGLHYVPLADGPTLTGTPAGWQVVTVNGADLYIPYWTK